MIDLAEELKNTPDWSEQVCAAIATVIALAQDAADQYIDQTAHDLGWPIELKIALDELQTALAQSTGTRPDES